MTTDVLSPWRTADTRRERRAAEAAMAEAYLDWCCDDSLHDNHSALAQLLNAAAAKAVRVVRDERNRDSA